MRIPESRWWRGFSSMIVYRNVCVCMCLCACVRVCVGGHLVVLAKPTEYNIKSPETNIHRKRCGLWSGRSAEEWEVRWSKMYLAYIYARGPSSEKSCRSTADLYERMINKVMCTNDLMFECIIALCFIHGFKLLWVNGFTTGLCSMASFMSQITKNHATLMRMSASVSLWFKCSESITVCAQLEQWFYVR